jgi:subtilisin family serine protease
MRSWAKRLCGLGLCCGILGALAGCSFPLPTWEIPQTRNPATHAQSGASTWNEGEILIGYEDESALARIVQALRGQILDSIYETRIALVSLPPEVTVLEAIEKALEERPPGLRYAEPNYIRHRITPAPGAPAPAESIAQDAGLRSAGRYVTPFNDPLRPRQWALDVMRAEPAWQRATGKGVIIGIVDTGMDGTHPDLQGKQLAGMDCMTGKPHPLDFDSSQMADIHATHVAGIAAAHGDNGVGIIGVAPDAQIMSIQIFNAELARPGNPSGYVGDARVAKCLLWAATIGPDGLNDSGDEAHILNNSWGGRGYSQTLKEAIDLVLESGVVFVNSMGNSSEDEILYPKGYPGVLAVGATNPKDQKVGFSTMGHQISVAAPGENILSTWPLWHKRPTGEPYSYHYLGGTSMAAPQVSGAVALLKELFPLATPYQLQKVLERTADDMETPGFDHWSGWGRINLARAVAISRLPEDGANVVITVVTQNRGDTNGDGVIDESDERIGVPFVDVLLHQDGQEKYFAQTNAQGEARFLSIEPGQYDVWVGGGDALIHDFRMANRITQASRIQASDGQTTELTLEFNTTLQISISWPESVDIDLRIGEPRPGQPVEWVSAQQATARWGSFGSAGPNHESYTLDPVHYPDALYPIAISAEHAISPANVTVLVQQNGRAESYGPFRLQPGQILPSSEWYDWWENFPDPKRGFLKKGPGGPWVY